MLMLRPPPQIRPVMNKTGYIYRGIVRKYRPDFLVRLNGDKVLVLACLIHEG